MCIRDRKYTIGSLHEVKVTRLADFGVFVELAPEIEGLVHIKELSTKRVNTPDEVCKVGDSIKAEVISIDQDARKVGLSVRLATMREQNADVSEYIQKTATPKASLGDLFGDQLKDLSDKK